MGRGEPASQCGGTAFAVLVALSVSHLLNDTIQSLIAAGHGWVPLAAMPFLPMGFRR